MFAIYLKESVNPEEMNEILEDMNAKDSFITPKMNQEWLDDINNNVNSPQRHLKPSNRKLRMKELKELLSFFTEENVLKCDTKFYRAKQEEIEKLVKFICDNRDKIEDITGSGNIIEKYEISEEEKSILEELERPYKDPEKLPEDEQIKPNLQSGIMLAKSWGPTPFWIVYGNTSDSKRVSFLRERIYKDDGYNHIYRDKEGYAYMLVPLFDFSDNFITNVIELAWEMGLREDPIYFAHVVYNFSSNLTEKEIGEGFKKLYSVSERVERLEILLERLIPSMKVGNIMLETTTRNRLVSSVKSDDFKNKLKVINSMLYSLKDDYARVTSVGLEEFYNGDVFLRLKFANNTMIMVK